MSINKANADIYFSTHYNSAVWNAFPHESRTNAISSARREFSRALGRAMNDDESAYVEGDMVREEYAVYEQALYFLRTGRIADGNSAAPYPVAMPESGSDNANKRSDATPHPRYSEDALRWLGQYNGVSLSRG